MGTVYKFEYLRISVLKNIKEGAYGKKVVAIGKQSFESVIENDNFYVDKTFFIKCNKEVLICVQYLKKQELKEGQRK